MTALTATAIRAVRARFGDLADAVMDLRAAHKTVRPYYDRYSVDEVVVDGAELQRMADAVKARRRTKQKTAGLEIRRQARAAGTTELTSGPGSALVDHHADPEGCVDVVPTGDVPPGHSPQTDDVAASSVTPVPEEGIGAGSIHESCGSTESRRAEQADGDVPQREPPNTAKADVPTSAAGVAPGPQDLVARELHRGATQLNGCAKVMRTEPSMSGSVAASGDAVRDASAMPLDVVAAPYPEGREHAGSAASAPSAFPPGNAGGSHDAVGAPEPVVARPATPATDRPATCPCSRPRGHGGRCWHMRGEAGPTLKRRRQPGRTCGCGGPLSYSARGDLCRRCHLATVRKTSGQAARIVALECEVDALKSAVERMRVQIAMEIGR